MRILLLSDLADPRRGSLVRQVHAGARELARRGHAVSLFATHSGSPPTHADPGFEVAAVRSSYPVRFRPFVGLWNPGVRGPLRAHLEAFRPDVVHAHLVHTHLSWSALRWARAAGARVVYTAHDVMSFCYQKMDCFHGGEALAGRGTDWHARLGKCVPCQRLRFLPGRNAAIRRILRRSVHATSAVSRALAERLREHGIAVDAVVPNAALEPAATVTLSERRAFRERHALGAGPVVLFAGRVQAQKGILQLLDALAMVRETLPEVRLLVASEAGLWERHARAHAERHGLLGACAVTGWLDELELEQAYAAADVLCVPSTCFETFGLVHLEAQRRGLPAIGSIYGGIPEVIRHGETGLCVNPFEPGALAAALAAVLGDPARGREMGRVGRERARREFALERVVDGWEALYETARSRPSQSAPGRIQ